MNANVDGARIRHQELDREIETLRTERLLNGSRPWRPGPVTRGIASVGRAMISVGTALAPSPAGGREVTP
jgi:hypothetical protein